MHRASAPITIDVEIFPTTFIKPPKKMIEMKQEQQHTQNKIIILISFKKKYNMIYLSLIIFGFNTDGKPR
jgi:hypothetical protein